MTDGTKPDYEAVRRWAREVIAAEEACPDPPTGQAKIAGACLAGQAEILKLRLRLSASQERGRELEKATRALLTGGRTNTCVWCDALLPDKRWPGNFEPHASDCAADDARRVLAAPGESGT